MQPGQCAALIRTFSSDVHWHRSIDSLQGNILRDSLIKAKATPSSRYPHEACELCPLALSSDSPPDPASSALSSRSQKLRVLKQGLEM